MKIQKLKRLKGDINKDANALPDKTVAPVVRKMIARAHTVSKNALKKQRWVK